MPENRAGIRNQPKQIEGKESWKKVLPGQWCAEARRMNSFPAEKREKTVGTNGLGHERLTLVFCCNRAKMSSRAGFQSA